MSTYPSPAGAKATPGQIQVLVADDDKQFLEAMAYVLGRFNLGVSVAANGLEALEILQTRKIDILILDIFMPGMNGFDSLTNIRKSAPDLPIVVLTGFKTPRLVQRVMELGCHTVLEKPCDALTLVEDIKRLHHRR